MGWVWGPCLLERRMGWLGAGAGACYENKLTVHAVVFEQVGGGLDGGRLVDVYQLQLGAGVKGDAEGQAACRRRVDGSASRRGSGSGGGGLQDSAVQRRVVCSVHGCSCILPCGWQARQRCPALAYAPGPVQCTLDHDC